MGIQMHSWNAFDQWNQIHVLPREFFGSAFVMLERFICGVPMVIVYASSWLNTTVLVYRQWMLRLFLTWGSLMSWGGILLHVYGVAESIHVVSLDIAHSFPK